MGFVLFGSRFFRYERLEKPKDSRSCGDATTATVSNNLFTTVQIAKGVSNTFLLKGLQKIERCK